LSVLHGAPLRLRCENELGFKMVKWISTGVFLCSNLRDRSVAAHFISA
jgi:DMSO/TMAO reductase YedYZ molybdopterin-dependent catalytic subunit